MQQIKREGSIKGEGGFHKKLKIPTLPPMSQRSGVTFHFISDEGFLIFFLVYRFCYFKDNLNVDTIYVAPCSLFHRPLKITINLRMIYLIFSKSQYSDPLLQLL